MLLIFVHGWSVTHTNTYGELPNLLGLRASEFGLEIDIQHVWLGRYLSFKDEITMSDVVRAFDKAIREQIPDNTSGDKQFSCITHSTGGPVVREWIERYYGAEKLDELPLKHLVMLAPANHGSALAALGKARVGRIKAWYGGIEPGQQILDWLCLGSAAQWKLCEQFLSYPTAENDFYPFVLTGQTIDNTLYDFINSYLAEVGSDGVVRVAGANLNYSMVKLEEEFDSDSVSRNHRGNILQIKMLKSDGPVRRPQQVPIAVIPKASHSGTKKGIMRSPTKRNSERKPVIREILRCLTVSNANLYQRVANQFNEMNFNIQATDKHSKKHRYTMLVFRISDDEGSPITDFDLFLLAGDDLDPGGLPKNFFVDRQVNKKNRNHLVYYLDYDRMKNVRDGCLGFRIFARPEEGFAYYHPVDFRLDGIYLNDVLQPNETIYIDIKMHRYVDKEVFRLEDAEAKQGSFKEVKPSGETVE